MQRFLLILICSTGLSAPAVATDARQVPVQQGSPLQKCRRITNIAGDTVTEIYGAEDITIHPRTGLAFLSAQDRRNPQKRGGIYTLDLSAQPEPEAVQDVTPNEPALFHPHGISLYVGPDTERLFVINHAATDQHRIEVFDVVDSRLEHVASIHDPSLTSPNDLFAVGLKQFYVTNDHESPFGTFSQVAEDVLGRDLANVVYYDGQAFTVVDEGLSYANGINGRPDSPLLYLTTTRPQTLRVYKRDATGGIELQDELTLGTRLDNIELDADGNLWIGSHPSTFKFLLHAIGWRQHAPSQIIVVSLHVPTSEAKEVYHGSGAELSASSVAAPL